MNTMRISCTVNGEPQQADDVWEGESLLYVLRERLGLPGLEERLRAGRVRLVHRLPGRHAGLRLPGRGRAGAGTRHPNGRGPGIAATSWPPSSRRSCGPARCSAASARRACWSPRTTCWSAADAERRGDPRGAGRQPVPVHRLREDHGRGPAGGRARGRGVSSTMDDDHSAERLRGGDRGRRSAPSPDGHWCSTAGGSRAVAAGPGRPGDLPGARYVNARGCLATPGLVNTHHHLYQWATRDWRWTPPCSAG